ncbi:MAG: glycosyltransferase family 39 protein [Candidatus Omnitrophica bacterium]|nr:glycosyltransferase family 39 protein [Candidatus Omnitrophota bacterium]
MSSYLRKNSSGQRRILILFLVFFSASILFFNLGKRSFWEPDEGRYAEISREMIESGDWLTPKLNHIKHFDKPPITFWLIGASFVLLGQNEFAGHLPLVLISLLGVLSTFALGKSLFKERVGFLSGIILIASLGYPVLSRLLSTDIILTLCCLLFYLFFIREKYLLLYLALALGFMTKGPVIFLLTLIPIFTYLIYIRDKRTFFKMRLGWGLLLVAALALPWYIYQVSINKGLLHDWLVQQTYNRVVRPIDDPFYFFIPVLLGLFFPQIVFLFQAFKKYLSLKRKPIDRQHAHTLLLFFWFLIPFIFFSCIGKKLVPYMLPILPALAILVARLWDEAMENAKILSGRGFKVPFYIYVFILFLLAAAMTVFLVMGYDSQVNITPARANIIFLVFIFSCAICASILAFRAKNVQRLFWIITLSSVFFFLTSVDILPKIETGTGRSLKELALKIKEDLKPQDKVVNYRCFLTSLPFYIGRRTIVVERQRNIAYEEEPAHYNDYLLKDKHDLYRLMDKYKVYCITYTWEFEKIKEEYPKPLYLLGQARKYVLFVNRMRPKLTQ